MNESNPKLTPFDVFLCHNSEDKPEIRLIAEKLSRSGLKPWLDEQEILPGRVWLKDLDTQIGTSKAAAVFVGKSGIGPWQENEIWAFLQQFVIRGCPVIPVILSSATKTPELPNLLQIFDWVDLRKTDPDPYEKLIRGITGEKSDYRKKLVSGNAVLKSSQDDAEVRPSPSIPNPPDQGQRKQLGILRDRVQEYWVDGVLRQSLYHEVLILLGKRTMDEVVEQPPWKYVVDLPDCGRDSPQQDHNIHTVFDATGLLLILGEPGSGKTTCLLELAAVLIIRAKDDSNGRVPIVLNLSSWQKKQSLEEWIAAELSAKYRVPKSIARAWLTQEYLVPLLDGLDEVQPANQADCVMAINAFIESHNPTGMVVCSRLMEYGRLTKRLTLNGAVCLEPLSLDDLNNFLTAGGPQLAGLHQALDSDPMLQDLAQTPLMLSIMSLACEGADGKTLANHKEDSPDVRRERIFQLYVERMFERKGLSTNRFVKNQVISWLSWLARKMKEQSQSLFMVEGLHPIWLSSKGERWAYEAVAALNIGMCTSFIGDTLQAGALYLFLLLGFSMTFLLSGGPDYSLLLAPIDNLSVLANYAHMSIVYGFLIGLSVFLGCRSTSVWMNVFRTVLISSFLGGLTITSNASGQIDSLPTMPPLITIVFSSGMIGWLGIGVWKEIGLVETMRWESDRFFDNARSGFTKGLVRGFAVALVVGLLFNLVWHSDMNSIQSSMIVAVLFGLLCGLGYGWISGLIAALVDDVRRDKTCPNQGVKLSLTNGFLATALGWLSSLFILLPAVTTLEMIFKPVLSGQVEAVVRALPGSLILIGMLVGLVRGGSSVMKHYALRLILWLNGSTPLRFIPFLDYCAKLILLKKVGGGYIFIHRTLLEYFAELPLKASKPS